MRESGGYFRLKGCDSGDIVIALITWWARYGDANPQSIGGQTENGSGE